MKGQKAEIVSIPTKFHAGILLVISILITTALLFTVTSQAWAQKELVYEKPYLTLSLQTGMKNAVLNGRPLSLEAAPFLSSGQLMIPLKSTVQALGGKYTYNAKTKSVTITKGKTAFVLKAGSRDALLNGKKVTLAAAVTVKPVLSAPSKFVAEALGAGYSWDEKSRKAQISCRDQYISFPDKALEKLIRSKLGKLSGDLPLSDMKKIPVLLGVNSGISDLSGLEYLTGLDTLYIAGSEVSDLTPLRSLNKLRTLMITNSPVVDLSPLSGLENLSVLYLTGNQIRDVAPLKNLKNLTSLTLNDNYIGDASPILELPSQTAIMLWDSNSRDELQAINSKVSGIVAANISPGMTDLEKEMTLHDYLVSHTRYDIENYDKGTIPDESHHPYAVLTKGVGVCDGYAEALQILFSRAGMESKVVLGEKKGPRSEGHAWNIAKLDNAWYYLDATFDDPVSQDNSSVLSHTYFNLSDTQASLVYKWDSQNYPKCTADNPHFIENLTARGYEQIDGAVIYSIQKDGIYRTGSNGDSKMLAGDSSLGLALSGEWLYYINNSDSKKIYKIRTDGTERMKVTDIAAEEIQVVKGILYFTDSENLYRFDETASYPNVIANASVLSSFFVYPQLPDILYYKTFGWNSGSRLYRANLDGSSPVPAFNGSIAGFTLKDNGNSVSYIFTVFEIYWNHYLYFINESDANRLYRISSDGSTMQKLADDVITTLDIEIVGDWVYYHNADDSDKYYRVKLDGSERKNAEGSVNVVQ